jgi:hypothetical protein
MIPGKISMASGGGYVWWWCVCVGGLAGRGPNSVAIAAEDAGMRVGRGKRMLVVNIESMPIFCIEYVYFLICKYKFIFGFNHL